MRCLPQNAVPEDPGDAGVTGVEAPSHATLRVVGQVLGVVAPPGAVVVPEVVERILGGPDGKDRLAEGFCRCSPRRGGVRGAHVGVSVGRLKHQEPGQ